MIKRGSQSTPADVSVILTAYQSERYVTAAVRSILAQEGVVADIILSDDASTDQTYAHMLAAVDDYAGPHHITLRQNPVNRGMDHGLELVELAAADVVVIAHADDISEPQRCRRLLDEMSQTDAHAATSNYLEIDESGWPAGLHLATGSTRNLSAEEIARTGWQPPLVGSTLALRRAVMIDFPPMNDGYMTFGHDTLLPFRGALLGGMRYVHEPLVRRRRHADQWGATLQTSQTPERLRESQASSALMFQAAMARDLRHMRAQAGLDQLSRLDGLQQIVTERLLEISAEWMAARQALHQQGLPPSWISQEVFAQENRRHARPPLREGLRLLYRRLRWQLIHR